MNYNKGVGNFVEREDGYMQCYHVWDKKGISKEDEVHQLIFEFCEEGAVLESIAFKDHHCIEDVGVEMQPHFGKYSHIRRIPEAELLKHGWTLGCQKCSKTVGNGVLIFHENFLCASCEEKEEKSFKEGSLRCNLIFRIWGIICWIISVGTCLGVVVFKGISLEGFSLSCLLWSIAFYNYKGQFYYDTPSDEFRSIVLGTFGFIIIPLGTNMFITGGIPTWLNTIVALVLVISMMSIIWIYPKLEILIVELVFCTNRWLDREISKSWLNLRVGDWIINRGCVCRVISNKDPYWITVDKMTYITSYSGTNGSGYKIFDVKDAKLSIDEIERTATATEIAQEKIRRKSLS